MKRALVGSLVVAAAATALAPRAWACKPDLSDHVSVFPSTDLPLPTTPRIVVEAYSTFAPEGYREAMPLDSHRADLRAGQERIALGTVASQDRDRTTIIVLAPDQPLRANTSYTLGFDP